MVDIAKNSVCQTAPLCNSEIVAEFVEKIAHAETHNHQLTSTAI